MVPDCTILIVEYCPYSWYDTSDGPLVNDSKPGRKSNRGEVATRETRRPLPFDTMAPKRDEGDGHLLRIGGRSWDLTNLYPNGKIPEELLSINSTPTSKKASSKCRSRRKKSKREASLYPSVNELDDSSFDFKPAAEVFRSSTNMQTNSPKPTSRPGAFHSVPGSHTLTRISPSSSPRRSGTLPGAFPSSSTSSKPKKPLPPLPSWVESPERLASKMKAKCVVDNGESSSSRHGESSDESHVDVYRQESMRSVQSTYSAGPARAEEEQDQAYSSSSRSQIEVAPGHYMPLRGSAETMTAVESGMARTVLCMACQATLLCVPDAELVVCPDCRLLSPLLPTESKAYSQTRTSHYESDVQPGVKYQVGGVGLGLKVETTSANDC